MLPFYQCRRSPCHRHRTRRLAPCYSYNMPEREAAGHPSAREGRRRSGAKPSKGRAQGSRQDRGEGSAARGGERKAVLNVTVSESLAADVRLVARLEHSTISSVVERALAEQVAWDIIRAEGLAAIDAYYQEHGYPTEEEMAAAEAQVKEEERLIDEARAKMGPEGWKPPAWFLEASWPGWWGAR